MMVKKEPGFTDTEECRRVLKSIYILLVPMLVEVFELRLPSGGSLVGRLGRSKLYGALSVHILSGSSSFKRAIYYCIKMS